MPWWNHLFAAGTGKSYAPRSNPLKWEPSEWQKRFLTGDPGESKTRAAANLFHLDEVDPMKVVIVTVDGKTTAMPLKEYLERQYPKKEGESDGSA